MELQNAKRKAVIPNDNPKWFDELTFQRWALTGGISHRQYVNPCRHRAITSEPFVSCRGHETVELILSPASPNTLAKVVCLNILQRKDSQNIKLFASFISSFVATKYKV